MLPAARGGRNRFTAAAHGAHGFDQAALHLRDAFQKLAHFIARGDHDRTAQVTGGDRVEVAEGIVQRTGNRAAQRQVRDHGSQHADDQSGKAHHAKHVEAALRRVVTLLGRLELELAQRVVGIGQIAVGRLQMLRAVDHFGRLVCRDHGRERIHFLMQRVAFSRDILRKTVFVGVARQGQILFPPHVGGVAHRVGALERRRGVRRTDHERGAVEREAFAGGVQLGAANIDRARHRVGEGVFIGVV
jgi:hypothetical protein